MEMGYCPNCGKNTGHQRKLGWGTFFGAVFTLGTSLLAIPFYPLRCQICGSAEWVPASDKQGVKKKMRVRTCPFCAEEIQLAAIKCKHCGERLPEMPEDVASPKQDGDYKRKQESAVSDNSKKRWGTYSVVASSLTVILVYLYVAYDYRRDSKPVTQLSSVEPENVQRVRSLAVRGSADSQCEFARMYLQGIYVSKDETKAAEWFQKAADQGHDEAEWELGWLYLNGRGVPKEEAKASEWFEKAAKQGMPKAQFRLGMMYAEGRGVPQNRTKAVEWYKKAADQGNVDARKALRVQ